MAAISIGPAMHGQTPLGFLRNILELPSNAGLFYAFGGSLDRTDAELCKPLHAKVLCETQASEWWCDYSRHASDRSADPIRHAIRSGIATD
jgi:hypothetical protein